MADIVSDHDSKVNIKKKGKKRKISKHIADAKLKSATMAPSPSAGIFDSTDPDTNSNTIDTLIVATTASTTTSSKKQKLTKQKHTKDPVDVEGYLMAWKQQHDISLDASSNQVTTTIWKFNKNTQSWLIRHLYDSTKISKSIFAIALQYFLKSNINVQQRLRDDAMERAILYQQQQQEKGTTNHNDEGKDGDDDKPKNKVEDESPEIMLEKNQRKEYKRARKILDTLVLADNTNGAK